MSTSPDPLTFSQKVQRFFFTEEVPYAFAMLRIAMSVVILEGVLARWRYCEELYSTNGVTVSMMENFGSYNYLQPLPPFWTACLMSVLVLALVTSALGWYTRFSLMTSLLMHVYLASNDTASTTTKFTVIQAHVLLLLSLSGCGRIWSIDSWLHGRRNPDRAPISERPAWATAPRWPQVLLILMIGISYMGAAITKLHMPDFITGDAVIYWIISNPNFRHSIGDWMSQHPGLLVVSSHFTVLWETVFVFLAWQGVSRKIVLGLGLFFHTMAALTLGEVTFLMVMSACYTGCLLESEGRYLGGLLSRLRTAIVGRLATGKVRVASTRRSLLNRLSISSPRFQGALATCVFLTAGFGGAWLNQRLDLYGMHRPEGPYELQPIEPEEVARLFSPAPPMREADKYLSVKLGSLKVGGRLSNHCDKFRYNDVLVCEASLNPPHEDMWMECHLLDGDEKIVHRDGTVAPREARWAQFAYTLTDVLEPGEYTLVIRSRGEEICRRLFTLEADADVKAPVAN